MSAIFLSASVPDREPYSLDFDVIAIREAVLALVAVTVRSKDLIFGGHPAISPLVEHAARSLNALDRVHIYQSDFFSEFIPDVAKKFTNLHWTSRVETREQSLTLMRKEMLEAYPFEAAVLIGGMEGISEELSLFREFHPNAVVLPVASTGGAAKLILDGWENHFSDREILQLREENRYRTLFSELLPNIA